MVEAWQIETAKRTGHKRGKIQTVRERDREKKQRGRTLGGKKSQRKTWKQPKRRRESERKREIKHPEPNSDKVKEGERTPNEGWATEMKREIKIETGTKRDEMKAREEEKTAGEKWRESEQNGDRQRAIKETESNELDKERGRERRDEEKE